MKVNLNELRARAKYISEVLHPDGNLIIWNYNHRCQYDQAWDDYTLMARGLITDLEGEVKARPFEKFFNYEEKKVALPTTEPEILEKLDGSLGILYRDAEGEARIATRGSFTSEQALKATEILHQRHLDSFFFNDLTYLFEIIYPQNRIVVNYNYEDIVLIGIRHIESGAYSSYNELMRVAENNGWKVPKLYPATDFETLKSLEKEDEEGFVIFYPQEGIRVKIKFEEYKRLHRLLTGFSSKSIWEILRIGGNIDELLERVPDEFYAWVKSKQKEFVSHQRDKMQRANLAYAGIATLPTRKDQAEAIRENWPGIAKIIFLLLDEKNDQANEAAWRMVKPKYERPFKTEI